MEERTFRHPYSAIFTDVLLSLCEHDDDGIAVTKGWNSNHYGINSMIQEVAVCKGNVRNKIMEECGYCCSCDLGNEEEKKTLGN